MPSESGRRRAALDDQEGTGIVVASVDAVLAKNHDGPGTVLTGSSYPELVTLVARMQAQDPRIIFDSLRPIGDEFWNMIDGSRSVREIAEAVCFEFGFDLDPELFLPLVDGLLESQAATLV